MTTRDEQTREATKRTEDWRQPSALPEVPESADYDFRWLRGASQNIADPANISSRVREGYAIVSPSEAGVSMLINEGGKDRVEIGGLMLARITKKGAKMRDSFYSNRSKGQEKALDQNLMKVDTAAMPVFANRKTEVTQSGAK